MKSVLMKLMAAAAIALASIAASQAKSPKEITVAYFLEWPTANQVAQVEGWYDKALGLKVNWRAFDTGTAMSAAMASGDVQIAYSHGLIPFIVAASQGLPIEAVGIAVSYAANDNCVVRNGTGITQDTAQKLEGQKVAVPIATVSQYKLLRLLTHLYVDVSKVNIVNMDPASGAAALTRGDVAMACGWGGALQQMMKVGSVLMTAKEEEAVGIRIYDLITVNQEFARENPELITQFLQVTDESAKYLQAHPDKAIPVIAKAAGMTDAAAKQMLDLSVFPTRNQQIELLKSSVPYAKSIADFLVEQDQIQSALNSYSIDILMRWLEKTFIPWKGKA